MLYKPALYLLTYLLALNKKFRTKLLHTVTDYKRIIASRVHTVREVTEMVSCIRIQVTVSKHGGIVNEPLYVQYLLVSSATKQYHIS